MICIAPCYRNRYCKYGIRSPVTARNNACGKSAAYALVFNDAVEYYCIQHIDKRYAEARYLMDSQLRRRGVIK